MNVLVTGATGFIGGNLCRVLVERGHHVRAFHRPTGNPLLLEGLDVEHFIGDLVQPETLQSAMSGMEVVFHAGAALGGRYKQTGRMYTVTVEGTRAVLQAAREAGVRRVVHTSTVAALGVPLLRNFPLAINENHTWNFRPQSYPYGYTKYLAEMEVQHAVARGMDVVIVNPTLVFGAGDVYRQVSSLVVQIALRRLPALVEGGINVVHIADVVEGHLLALEHGQRGQRYILGGENLTILELGQKIAQATGAPLPPVLLPAGAAHSFARLVRLFEASLPMGADALLSLRLAGRFFYYDTLKARSELGLINTRPAEDAIADAVAWFRQVGAIPPAVVKRGRERKELGMRKLE